MPRIPELEIDRIKVKTDLAALVRSRGIELKKHGNGHLAGKCPFHDEKEASFIVTPCKGLFHCMGCGVAGNAIQFVQKFDGVSFRHAYELLKEGEAAFRTSYKTGRVKRTTMRRLENPFKVDAEYFQLYGQVVDYYHSRLLNTPVACEYLKSRGLFDKEAIDKFRIGFADRTIGMRLPESDNAKGRSIREKLKKTGILRESGHEHFAGSIVIPIYDNQGSVSEMYGRKINKNLRAGTAKHLYLPGPHAGIWNEEAAMSTGELILCEAPLDALTFWVNGFKNVTFTFGNEGFPKYLFEALLRHNIRTVRLAYDADESGERAAKRDIEKLTAHGIDVYRIKFPWGMDVNEYARKITPAGKSLSLAVRSAEWHSPDRGYCQARAQTADATSESYNIRAVEETDARAPVNNINNKIATNLVAEKKTTSSGISVDLNLPAEAPASEPKRETPSLERSGDYHILNLGQRSYRVGGLEKNNSLEVLKVAVRITYTGQGTALFHLDSFDMTRDGDRRRFIERSAEETGLEKELIKRDLGKLLLTLEEAQQERLNAVVESRNDKTYEMTSEEHRDAMAFLKSPDLIKRITSSFSDCGLVGEEVNSLAAYLACTSRKLDKPLAVIIQSTSAAGKSTLMDAVLAMFPEEERIKYSAMTGQSLFYLGETELKHKILAIVEEEGAEKASYALKLLQSEGELTIASTGKDPHTGRMETQEYHVEGPVMIFLTTTAIEIDEELQNRCLMLTVDESRAQTERIHVLQREDRTLEGLRRKKRRQRVLKLLRNAQRLIKPIEIMNPYSRELTFTVDKTRTRRDNLKYLSLIDAIALLHQHQRKIESDPESSQFIRVTLDDIEVANRLAPELLGRSLDELSPQTRRLLSYIKALVRDKCEREDTEQSLLLFSRKELREHSGWSEFQVRIHISKLEALEYVDRRWGRQGKRYSYELLVDMNEPEEAWHIGLLDVAKLRKKEEYLTTTTETSSIQNPTSGQFVKKASRSEKPLLSVAFV